MIRLRILDLIIISPIFEVKQNKLNIAKDRDK